MPMGVGMGNNSFSMGTGSGSPMLMQMPAMPSQPMQMPVGTFCANGPTGLPVLPDNMQQAQVLQPPPQVLPQPQPMLSATPNTVMCAVGDGSNVCFPPVMMTQAPAEAAATNVTSETQAQTPSI